MEILKKSFFELVGVIAFVSIVLIIIYFISGEEEVKFLNANLVGEDIVLEVADNIYLQGIGLSGREDMPMDYGMIFVYDYELEGLTFWMKDTLIPLDMIFLNEDFEIVHIIENVPICEEDPCERYTFDGKAKYVVELNAGWVEKYDVELGDVLKLKAPGQSDS